MSYDAWGSIDGTDAPAGSLTGQTASGFTCKSIAWQLRSIGQLTPD